jgi:hypothetical protein
MNPWTAYLPTRKVLNEILRKYDNPQREPFTAEELHWMVNVLHALNDEPEYQKAQDALEAEGYQPVVEAPHEDKPSINIAPPDADDDSPSTIP